MTSDDGQQDSENPWATTEPTQETKVETIEALDELREAEERSPSDDVSSSPTLVGETVGDRYRIERQIARGGMGLIYLAVQKKLERQVVVKVLPPKLVSDEQARERFTREAQGLSNLQHPNIVTVHDFGLHHGVPYIAMEYLEGETLSKRLYRDRRIPIRPFLRIVSQTLDALAEAHAERVIHRDIKPENIMLCERGNRNDFVKMLDFGLAKLAYKDQGITNEDDVVGTVSYMAPEYILGDGVDSRSDVYSMAVLFYVMLSGRKPYDADDKVQVLYAHVHDEPIPLERVLPGDHEVPEGLIGLIHQCMAKDPDARPSDANELLQWMLDHISHSKLRVPTDSGTLTPEPRQVPSDIVEPRSYELSPSSSDETIESMPPPGSSDSHSPRGTLAGDTTPESADTTEDDEADPEDEQPSSLVLPAILGLVLATVIIALLVLPGDETRRPAGSGEEAAAAPTDDERATETLDRADTQIDEGALDEAERLLGSLSRNDLESERRRKRLAALKSRLATAQMLRRAGTRADAGERSRAITLYENVLAEDPDNERANRALAALESSDVGDTGIDARDAGEDDTGPPRSVTIESDPEGRVFLDGSEAGSTPITLHPTAGEHDIEIRADGHESWNKSLELGEEGQQTIIATLDEKRDPSTESASSTSSEESSGGRPPESDSEPSSSEESTDSKQEAPATSASGASDDPTGEDSRAAEKPAEETSDEQTPSDDDLQVSDSPSEKTSPSQKKEGEKSEEPTDFRVGGDEEEDDEGSFRVD